MGIKEHLVMQLSKYPSLFTWSQGDEQFLHVEHRYTHSYRKQFLIEITDKAIYLYEMVPIEVNNSGTVTRQREDKPIEVWYYQ